MEEKTIREVNNDVTEPRNGAYQKNKLRKLVTELRNTPYGAAYAHYGAAYAHYGAAYAHTELRKTVTELRNGLTQLRKGYYGAP